MGMQSEGQVDDFESGTLGSRVFDRDISLKWVNVEGGQESTSSSLNSLLKCCRVSTVFATKLIKKFLTSLWRRKTGWLSRGPITEKRVPGLWPCLNDHFREIGAPCFFDCRMICEH